MSSRVRHTSEEKYLLVQTALQIRRNDPMVTDRQLYVRSQLTALPADRRRQTQTMPRVAYQWLVDEVDKALSPPPSPPSPVPTPGEAPAAEGVEVRLQTQGLLELGREIQQLRDEMSSLVKLVREQSNYIGMLHTSLNRATGDVMSPPPQHAHRREDTIPIKARARRVKIGLVGPLPAQAQEIGRQVGEAVQVVLIDKDKHLPVHTLRDCKYIVMTRHVGHKHINEAQKAVGRERVVMVQTGGIETISSRIKELVSI